MEIVARDAHKPIAGRDAHKPIAAHVPLLDALLICPAAEDAELVALRISQDGPTRVGFAQVIDHRRAKAKNPLDLLVTVTVDWP